jgi:hypothetical protein
MTGGELLVSWSTVRTLAGVAERHRHGRLVVAVAALLGALLMSGCAGKPGGSFPTAPSPRDGLAIRYILDVSCDALPASQADQRTLTYYLVTEAAWHEGSFGAAPIRNDAIENLNFDEVRFVSQMHSPEAIRRDLRAQRNEVSIPSLVSSMRKGSRGPCRTDLLAAFGELQRNLSGTGVGRSPVVAVAVTNGIVVARGLNFYRQRPNPRVLIARLKAQGLVASLPGVRVFFVGLGRVPGGIGLNKARWIEQFWLEYTRAAGATPVLVRSVDDLITRLRGTG